VSDRRPMQELADAGQSVWLDYIRRDLMETGELDAMIDAGLRGMTSNPSIFEKAIGGSDLYDEAIATLLAERPDATTVEIFESLAIDDIRAACDAFARVYEETSGADGFVSLEVAPDLAHDTETTISEARRLWAAVDRPNLMIKVPATPEGLPAITELIASGVNVNVTLIFSLVHYEAVANAFIAGIEQNAAPHEVASVASVFISRIDSAVDKLLDEEGSGAALALRGEIAVANCKVVYALSEDLFGDDFEAIWGRGVRPQRPLWASTSTKDPDYSDVKYVEELVGEGTVNTVPPATLDAFEDHGVAAPGAVAEGLAEARAAIAALSGLGVDLDAVCDELRAKGVTAFVDAFDGMLSAIDEKKARLLGA
jgi:transaldolase